MTQTIDIQAAVKEAREAEMMEGIRHIQSRVSNEELFRAAYIPFVVGRLVWDYADTIIDLCILMRISETKGLCRTIRRLKQEYDQCRAAFIDQRYEDSEERNMYVYERYVADKMSLLLVNLKATIKTQHPDLIPAHHDLLVAVYQCRVLLKSVLRYSARQTAKIAKKLGWALGEMLPSQFRALDGIVLEFAGDCRLAGDWPEREEQFIATFANQMALIGMTDKEEAIFNAERKYAL